MTREMYAENQLPGRERTAEYRVRNTALPFSDFHAEQVQQDYYKAGVGTLLIGIFVYLLLSVVLGVATGMASRRQARPGA